MANFVQVITQQIIKPSSESESEIRLHPKKLQLSYIDQWIIPVYIPLIFFFKSDQSTGLTTSNHPQISQRLKDSLQQILPSFYPLAGRLNKNLFVDCNDAGVEFVEARARARLDDVVCRDEKLKQYLPSECTAFNHGPRPLLVVQLTFFECGGAVIGACFSHKISDMASAMEFMMAWAVAFRGEAEAVRPIFGAASYLPSIRLVPWSRYHKLFTGNKDFRTKRFLFDKEKLESLRKASTSPSESDIKNPSRVELISAFIWKHFMAARLHKKKSKKIYAAFHAVNLRTRTTPCDIFENVFGNCFMPAMAIAGSGNELSLHELVARLRRSIARVRGSYITKPMSKESFMRDMLKLSILLMMGKVEWCFFTSWRGFPTYELDFGWGKPAWFSTSSMPARNLITLVSSKSGDDIEAIVTMMPNDLQILDAQFKLISTNCSNCID